MQPIQSKPFQLNNYPYMYQCPSCKDIQPFQKDEEEFLKGHYEINSELPLGFECSFCPGSIMRPIGYTGDLSFVMDSENDYGN